MHGQSTNDIVVPVDAEVEGLALRTGRLGDLWARRRRVRAGAVSGGARVMVRTQAVRIRDGLRKQHYNRETAVRRICG